VKLWKIAVCGSSKDGGSNTQIILAVEFFLLHIFLFSVNISCRNCSYAWCVSAFLLLANML